MGTEVDAVQKNAISGEDQLVTIKALNEFDSKAQGSGGALDWRSKLVTQRGAVVATEMKNNSCKLRDFANQMNLQLSNGWGIVRTIADMCLRADEGKCALVKDPNKSILRLYQVPSGSLDDDDEEEELEEEEGEGEDEE